MKIFLLCCLLLLIPRVSYSIDKKPEQLVKMQKELETLKGKLSEQTQRLTNAKAVVHTIENKLVSTHQKHREMEKAIKHSEKQLEVLSEEIHDSEIKLRRKYKLLKNALAKYLLLYTSQDLELDGFYQSEYYEKLFSKGIGSIKESIDENQKNKRIIAEIQQKLGDYKSVENEIYTFMVELEGKKKNSTHQYLELVESRQLIENKLISQKSNYEISIKNYERKKRRSSKDFMAPLKSYVRYENSGKGINFYYKGKTPFYSPKKGQVIYLGELASYGNIIMIEHDNQMRSVILGEISANVKKGDKVDKGTLIGHTANLKEQALYFEIRKRNLAMNTKTLLSKL